MHYKAVIFDLDGTLLDTLQDLADAANQALADLGFPRHPVDAYRFFVGSGLNTLIVRILPEGKRDEQTQRQTVERFKQRYRQNWKATSAPYVGVPAMLDQLQANGVKLCVLSNKPHDYTTLCVQELLPQWTFFQVLGQRSGVPKKPDARGALDIVHCLGLQKRDILYVGDTAIDMQTAANAQLDSVGVLWGFRSAEELQAAGARYLISSPEELVGIVKSGPDFC
ncbi:MAG: HAD family hydrolase [Desulfobulbus propionicus]|nr:MAG: HAD family hydrolase [Desulfobulbus propionicus]